MTRTHILLTLCFVLVGLSGAPAAAFSQPPVDRPATETAKTPQKPRSTASKSAPVKATTTSLKPTASATAKTTDKPGKRFWSRIMNCFRDVHSVEKKTSKE